MCNGLTRRSARLAAAGMQQHPARRCRQARNGLIERSAGELHALIRSAAEVRLASTAPRGLAQTRAPAQWAVTVHEYSVSGWTTTSGPSCGSFRPVCQLPTQGLSRGSSTPPRKRHRGRGGASTAADFTANGPRTAGRSGAPGNVFPKGDGHHVFSPSLYEKRMNRQERRSSRATVRQARLVLYRAASPGNA